MFNETTYSASRRFCGLLVVVLLVLYGVTICWPWHHSQFNKPLTKEQNQFVDSLVAAANRRPAQIRVALFDAKLDDGEATKDLKRILEGESVFAWEVLNSADIQPGWLSGYDVVIIPGGNAVKQIERLGSIGKDAVREFVRDGGGYVGICGGAKLATAGYDWSLALVNAKTLTGMMDIPGVGAVSLGARGGGTVNMELTDAGRRIFSDCPGLMKTRFCAGPIFLPAGLKNLPECVSLAAYRTEICRYEPQRGTMIDTPAIIAGHFGKGQVIIFSPHPEMTEGLEPLVCRAVMAVVRMRDTAITRPIRQSREL